MQKIFFLIVTVLATISIDAQSIKLPVGKKFGMTIVSELTTTASAMGQEMEIKNTFTNATDSEIKKITGNGFTLTNTVKKTRISISMMGHEQTFDSENAADRNNPEMADAFKSLDKPFDVEISDRKTVIAGDAGNQLVQLGLPAFSADQQKIILDVQDLARLKQGNQWTDSLVEEGGKVVHQYTVSKIDGMNAELLVKSTLQMTTNIKQGGMDTKQSMKGIISAKRTYNKETGLLKREESDIDMSGSVDMMGISAPMRIKGKMTTTINE